MNFGMNDEQQWYVFSFIDLNISLVFSASTKTKRIEFSILDSIECNILTI
jgi:hypothetical protein